MVKPHWSTPACWHCGKIAPGGVCLGPHPDFDITARTPNVELPRNWLGITSLLNRPVVVTLRSETEEERRALLERRRAAREAVEAREADKLLSERLEDIRVIQSIAARRGWPTIRLAAAAVAESLVGNRTGDTPAEEGAPNASRQEEPARY